jgi:quercetin dioxygenase-like cupin family protein
MTFASTTEGRRIMNTKSKITLTVVAGAAFGVLITPFAAMADNVPDALSVEWQGKKPCEQLFEDAQVRVARCTFPPGATHVCHSHPSHVYYVLSGVQGEVQDDKGTRKVDLATGTFVQSPPIPWHVFTNIGQTTYQVLLVEKKYEPATAVSQAACPK